MLEAVILWLLVAAFKLCLLLAALCALAVPILWILYIVACIRTGTIPRL